MPRPSEMPELEDEPRSSVEVVIRRRGARLRALLGQLLARLEWLRMIRFGLVGLTGVVVNLAIVQLLFGYLHWAAILSSAVAVEASVVNNFLWNNRWTFGQRTISPVRFARFNLASLGGLVINSAVFSLLVQQLAMYYLLADLVAIGAATGWNFLASVFWTWAS